MLALGDLLARIPGERDALNEADDTLMKVLRRVETILGDLRPGVEAEVDYNDPIDGAMVLGWGRHGSNWRLLCRRTGTSDIENVALTSTSRAGRAAVFLRGDGEHAPIMRLLVAVATALSQAVEARRQPVAGARQVEDLLAYAGFTATKPT